MLLAISRRTNRYGPVRYVQYGEEKACLTTSLCWALTTSQFDTATCSRRIDSGGIHSFVPRSSPNCSIIAHRLGPTGVRIHTCPRRTARGRDPAHCYGRALLLGSSVNIFHQRSRTDQGFLLRRRSYL